MAGTALVIGFFTAIGWWSAGKITTIIDCPSVQIEQQVIKQEKRHDNRN